jgi:hypothetical protein
VATGIEQKLFDSLGRTLTTVPDDLTVHKTLGRVIDAKREMFATGTGFDWATAEALAYGSLVTEGYNVRLSGQDCGRGTFSQRHAVWVDQKDEHKYVPLTTLPHGRFQVLDSPLSEYGVLGFEYGYASADPKTLVLWEAQFGDFANGAQIVIDQYVAAADPSGCAPTASSCCCPTAMKARDRSTRRPVWNAIFSSAPKTTSRSATSPARPTTSTCCAGRCTARSASRSSS